MTISTTLKNVCIDTINNYIFDRVWNEPVSEYRSNIHPQPMFKRSKVGTFNVPDANIYLPSTVKEYYVWYMHTTDMNIKFKFASETWVSLDTICNEHNLLVHAHTSVGGMLPKCAVFFRLNKRRNTIFIAIEKSAWKCIEPISDLNELYFTFYHDSDLENNIRVLSFRANIDQMFDHYRINITNLINQRNADCCVLMFHNGEEVTTVNNGAFNFKINDYYDVIVDNNIKFAVDIDLSDILNDHQFLSVKDKVHKQLIHIPRELNPNNDVITHNTCDFFVRRNDSHAGRYLTRVTTKRTVSQVTHNDMAIPMFVVDAYRDYLQYQSVSLHLVARKHDKDNVLVRDSNYIDMLYHPVHTDEDIIKFLTGTHTTKIPFWEAAVLEDSTYVKHMFDSPNEYNSNNIPEYVDSLGYFSVANLLCKRTHSFIVGKDYDGRFTCKLPAIYTGATVLPIVYVNGRKLALSQYSYRTNTDANTCELITADTVTFNSNDKITIEFIELGDSSTLIVTPGVNEQFSFEVPWDDYIIHQRITNIGEFKGVKHSSIYSYRKIEPNTNVFASYTDNGVNKVLFNDMTRNNEYIIQNRAATLIRTINLAEYTASGENISIPLVMKEADDTEYPILNIGSASIFLNGSYLVRGLDYLINTVHDDENGICFSELVLQTMDHFNDSGDDLLEIIVGSDIIVESSDGFVMDNKLYDNTPISIFFPNITTVHVEGSIETNGEFHGTYVSVPEGKYPNGGIFEVQTVVPDKVEEFLNGYGKQEALDKLNIVNDYFYKTHSESADIVTLDVKHRIYSVFINAVINSILNNNGVADDPDNSRLMSNIKPYLYLKQSDIVFREDLNKLFIDLYPQYVNYQTDSTVKRIVDRYVKLLMPSNVNPTIEVVYE